MWQKSRLRVVFFFLSQCRTVEIISPPNPEGIVLHFKTFKLREDYLHITQSWLTGTSTDPVFQTCFECVITGGHPRTATIKTTQINHRSVINADDTLYLIRGKCSG